LGEGVVFKGAVGNGFGEDGEFDFVGVGLTDLVAGDALVGAVVLGGYGGEGEGGGLAALDVVLVGEGFFVVVPLVGDVGAVFVESLGGELEGDVGVFVGGLVGDVLGDLGAVVDGEVDFVTGGGASGVGGLEAVLAGLGGVNFFEGEGVAVLFVEVFPLVGLGVVFLPLVGGGGGAGGLGGEGGGAVFFDGGGLGLGGEGGGDVHFEGGPAGVEGAGSVADSTLVGAGVVGGHAVDGVGGLGGVFGVFPLFGLGVVFLPLVGEGAAAGGGGGEGGGVALEDACVLGVFCDLDVFEDVDLKGGAGDLADGVGDLVAVGAAVFGLGGVFGEVPAVAFAVAEALAVLEPFDGEFGAAGYVGVEFAAFAQEGGGCLAGFG